MSHSPGASGGHGCQCKRGFFTLRDCENQAAQTCVMCQRGICNDHLAPRVDAVVCVECAARQEEQLVAQGQQPPTQLDHELQDPRQSAKARHRLRHRYYDSGYEPVFWGSYYGGYYSDYDMRGFDDDEAYEGGFGDS